MADVKLRFGDRGDIAFTRTGKEKRDRLLSHSHGFESTRLQTPALSQEDFDKIFGSLEPVGEDEKAEVVLQRENGSYPQYEISPRVIMLSGWYGEPDTQELGRVGKWTRVDILGVRRPQGERGPAPSWKVREVAETEFETGRGFYIGKRGKYFIGETPGDKQ